MTLEADDQFDKLLAAEQQRDEMKAFFEELRQLNMEAIWGMPDRPHAPPPPADEPTVPYRPCRWRWSVIRPLMDRAGRLVEPGPDAERRVIKLIHPELSGPNSTPTSRYASHSVSGNVQMILPGESAPVHRHRNNAIRFIVEGDSAFSIVNGEAVEMRRGDLVLTPSFYWHGHVSESTGPVLWMDSLDGPLVGLLKQKYTMEKWPEGQEAVTQPSGVSLRRFGTRFLRPRSVESPSPLSPLLIYPWTQIEQALQGVAALDGDPFDDVAFYYANPSNGAHVTPTLGCQIQMIRPGVHTRAHRHASTHVFNVVRGRGSTIVDGVEMEWEEGDFFTLPPHCWHEHINSSREEAILFSTTDAPVIEALGLYREDPYIPNDGRQEVTSRYVDSPGFMS